VKAYIGRTFAGVAYVIYTVPFVLAGVLFLHSFVVLKNPWTSLSSSAIAFIFLVLYSLQGSGGGGGDKKEEKKKDERIEFKTYGVTYRDFSADGSGDGD
jgi:hypothetical protein